MDRDTQGYRIRIGAQLAAIEHMVIHLFALQAAMLDDKQFAQMEMTWAAGVASQTIPGVDAASSDLLADELGQQTLRLLRGVAEARKMMRERMG
jgi:hypothetical protein